MLPSSSCILFCIYTPVPASIAQKTLLPQAIRTKPRAVAFHDFPHFFPPYLDLSKEEQLLLLSAEKRQDKREQKRAVHTAKWSPFVQNPHQSDHSLQVLKREPQVFIKPVCEARAA